MEMGKLTAQVKRELLRTLFWLAISLGVATTIYYIVW